MTLEINMQTRDHVRTARELLTAADSEFEAGDHLQASEKLWDAASHALTAVAQQRNLPHGSHRGVEEGYATARRRNRRRGRYMQDSRWRRNSTRISTTTSWKISNWTPTARRLTTLSKVC